MAETVAVEIHPSQFPEALRAELLRSLRERRINHKFLYESPRQTAAWLALHEAYSPARTDSQVIELYDAAFDAAAQQCNPGPVHLIGLGCGGGQKDARLLKLLSAGGSEMDYTPADVGTAMVLEARQAALPFIEAPRCHPLVLDLTTANDVQETIAAQHVSPNARRLISFFGMIPNFEPGEILPRLAGLLRSADLLLVSANLAPGPDYAQGVRRILPLYDNALTRQWLLGFLISLGIDPEDGKLEIDLEERHQLLRVKADYRFTRARTVTIEGEVFSFEPGARLRVFYSYRYTIDRLKPLLSAYGVEVLEHWASHSDEEGVLLCRKG